MKKSKPEIVNIYYIGNDFYGNSGTMMSSIYLEGGYRTDWSELLQWCSNHEMDKLYC